jgi:hypothetical protein
MARSLAELLTKLSVDAASDVTIEPIPAGAVGADKSVMAVQAARQEDAQRHGFFVAKSARASHQVTRQEAITLRDAGAKNLAKV